MSFMNRMANSKNQFQGDAKRVLCVCSAGLLRSPTTAVVLAKEFGHNTRAAGMSKEFALIPVDEVLIHWADEIVFMERSHLTEAIERWHDHLKEKQITVLEIPDSFSYMDTDLQTMILDIYNLRNGG